MTFRILSLDGGGTWALLEAMALADLHPGESGRQVLAHYDLAVACSGGSIVLGGLMLDRSPAEIASIFADRSKRESIFYKKHAAWRLLSRLPIFPRYVAKQKRVGLGELFGIEGEERLGDLPATANWPQGPAGDPVRVLIMAFDYDRLRGEYLRSYGIPKTGAEAEPIALVDAIHASSNAPVTFFDAPAVANGRRYWDGAMAGYNNPLLAGVVDAIALDVDPKSIVALTIGAGTVRLAPPDLGHRAAHPRLVAPQAKPGPLHDVGRAAGCITNDPPDSATYTAHIVLGNHPGMVGRVIRLSPVVHPVRNGEGEWDYPEGLPKILFDHLATLRLDALRWRDVDVIERLGEAWIGGSAPNQPIRMGDDLSCQIGHDTYAEAKAAWKRLSA